MIEFELGYAFATSAGRARAQHQSLDRLFLAASRLERVAITVLRLALIIVLMWIGSLKFAKYEADSIVPFVANSPLMSFFYHHPAPEYRHHVNKEGELNVAHRKWHQANGTYAFSDGLGIVIVGLALLIALHPLVVQVSAVGGAGHADGVYDSFVSHYDPRSVGAGTR